MKRMFASRVLLLVAMTCTLVFGGYVAKGNDSLRVVQDTAYGGQLKIKAHGIFTIPPHDSVRTRLQWSFNPTFASGPSTFLQPTSMLVYSNTDSVAVNINYLDSLPVSATGTVFVRLIAYGRWYNDTSFFAPVVVDSTWQHPHISFGSTTATSDGGIQVTHVNSASGHHSAHVDVYVSPGDTNLTYPYLVDGFDITNYGDINYVFTGYPHNYYFSYKFVITNPLGSDTTIKKWCRTLPSSGSAWISDADSTSAGVDSIYVQNQVVTNGLTTTVVYHYGITPSGLSDSVTQIIAGVAGLSNVGMSIGGLLPSTTYYVHACARNSTGGTCSSVITLTTGATPVVFNVLIDTNYFLSAGTQRIHVLSAVPAGETAQVSVLVADSSDVSWAFPIYAPALVTVGEGASFLDFDVSGLASGHAYRVKAYGFSSSSVMINPTGGTIFRFENPVPNVTFTTTDSVVRGSIISLNWTSSNCVWKGFAGIGPVMADTGHINVMVPYSQTFTFSGAGVLGDTVSVSRNVVAIDTATISYLYKSRDTVWVGQRDSIYYGSAHGITRWMNGNPVMFDSGLFITAPITHTMNDTFVVYGWRGQMVKNIVTIVAVDTPPHPSVTISANHTSIPYGSNDTISWTSTNCTSVTVYPLGAVSFSGTAATGALFATTTYVIVGVGPLGDFATDTVVIAVLVSTPTVSFHATRTSILYGGNDTLVWTSTNCVDVTIYPLGTVSFSGMTATGALFATTTYVITGVGHLGDIVTDSVTITVVVPAPVINSYTVDNPVLLVGHSTIKRWSTSGCVSLSMSSVGALVSDTGSTVTPIFTTVGFFKDTLTGIGVDGTIVKTVVMVHVVPDTTVTGITSFVSDTDTVAIGGSTMLHWATTGISSALLNYLSVSVNGSQSTGALTTTTTFTLLCTNYNGGVFTRALTVYVKDTTHVNAVHDIVKDESISFDVYPNPTSELITIKNGNFRNEDFYFMIDINGRVVAQIPATESIVTFKFGDLPNGIYFVKYGNTSQKIIKK